ncbi:MAG TPA: hemolysin D [Cyanobacteria bacterium UBA11149]|nr:hemolysin D [Cyanobacteria bacterium UBA11367]HBE60871.1 hemolysin D [Cyanobacteria bacterium UBA11366]HBK65388.1 hemolysin D [Cyanobacteria bacterium UBA11166]HBR74883.1 hemolysin D [Cyanobacteria bacterium UBA11159]HBS67970.1 hemolysin D [Cyanobacteria bacterium UBA11153]HBW92101.1 hemolysin D [Cyanobacteria bacterium UBA11149]HCA96465.1 hemolysin D [Cyanobacteria bacterium UBA9226]
MNSPNGSQPNSATTRRRQNRPLLSDSGNNHRGRSNHFGREAEFDRPVILQQSPIWSRCIVWAIVGVTASTLIWAYFAKIDEAIPAQGKLEPKGAVKDVQAPIAGVVKTIDVKEGQRVEVGDRLLTFDQTAAEAQFQSLQKIRESLLQENQFYISQLQGTGSKFLEKTSLRISPEMISLTENRASLISENKLYQAQLQEDITGTGLNSEQQLRLQSILDERRSREAAAELEVQQLTQQLSQTTIQLANARNILSVNQEIVTNIEPLVKEGGFARLQFLKQQQEVTSSKADVIRLTQEEERLRLAIEQAREKLKNTKSLSETDVRAKISDNDKRISDINSQITKIIVENNKKIREIDSQISQTKLTLKYQDLVSPVTGTVFELKAKSPGFVANTSEPVLKIVPDEGLIAKVFITNRDIGFIKGEMDINSKKEIDVDVRVDSFPYSEFGDIKGKLVRIGSDALPPDEIYPFYRFPAEIKIDKQSISVNKGKLGEVELQSGMSVSVNIKVRQRTVMSIFSDLFVKKLDSLKNVR